MKGKMKSIGRLCVISGSMLVFAVLGVLILLNGTMASADEGKKEFSTSQSVSGSAVLKEKEEEPQTAGSIVTELPCETEVPNASIAGSQSGTSTTGSHSNEWKLGSKIAKFAMTYEGCPYEYGGAVLPEYVLQERTEGEANVNVLSDTSVLEDQKGVDSSGFVQAVFKEFKIGLPRSSKEQANMGEEIAIKDAQPGDVIFYGVSDDKVTHCGICIGDRKVIHSSAKEKRVMISDLNYRRIAAVKRMTSALLPVSEK